MRASLFFGLCGVFILLIGCSGDPCSTGLMDEVCPPSSETPVPDNDGDGFSVAGGDCDDNNAKVYPSAVEWCDLIDDNCNGQIDEDLPEYQFCQDVDLDGVPGLEFCQLACGYLEAWTWPNQPYYGPQVTYDCNDTDPLVYPGSTVADVTDGVDQDCDGIENEDEGITECAVYKKGYVCYGDCLVDDDGDYYADTACDCDDRDPLVYPGALEILDGKDNDCDGIIDNLPAQTGR